MNDNVVDNIDQFINGINFYQELEQFKANTNIFRQNINNPRYKLNPNNVNAIQIQEQIENGVNVGYEEYKCKKIFFDKMTDLVSKEVCFRDNRQLQIVRFQYLVNNMFNTAIEQYIRNKEELIESDILFLYKGGTTMRIIYNKYKDIITRQENRLLRLFQSVERNFERSDSDYSIFINLPDLMRRGINFEEIKRDMVALNYIILNYIRFIIDDNGNNILDLSIITDDILRNKIVDMNRKLQEIKNNVDQYPRCNNIRNINRIIGIGTRNNTLFTEPIPQLNRPDIDNSLNNDNDDLIESAKIKEFIANRTVSTNKRDFYMTKNNDNRDVVIPLEENQNIYLSLNEITEFVSRGLTFAFTLNRLKINFICYYVTEDNKYGFFDCPSELIDVSIIKSNSDSLGYFYHHGVNKETKQYDHIFDDENRRIKLRYNGYTIFGFINDLLLVLFVAIEFPWNDDKYRKRLERLILFIYLEMFITFRNNIVMINRITEILQRTYRIVLNQNNLNQNIITINNNINEIKDILYNNHLVLNQGGQMLLRNQILNNYGLSIFLDKYLEIFNNQNFNTINNLNNYNIMANIIVLLLNNFNNLIVPRLNFNQDVFRNVEDIPEMKKYLKYKKKYLELKKQMK